MKFSYRITKYDTKYRNEEGHYLLQNEWTCYSQVGTKCGNEVLAIDEYLEKENSYIQSIILFMKCNQIELLKVTGGLEKRWDPAEDQNSTKEMIYLFNKVKDGDLLNIDQVKNLSRLALRNYIWCKLESDAMFVHFYFDYYMYVGSQHECKKAIEKIEERSLFVEDFKSPYLDDDEEK